MFVHHAIEAKFLSFTIPSGCAERDRIILIIDFIPSGRYSKNIEKLLTINCLLFTVH